MSGRASRRAKRQGRTVTQKAKAGWRLRCVCGYHFICEERDVRRSFTEDDDIARCALCPKCRAQVWLGAT